MKASSLIHQIAGELRKAKARLSRRAGEVTLIAGLVTLAHYSVAPARQILDTADLNVARVGHTATQLADGRILLVGGENATGAVSDSEVFDPLSRRFFLGARTLEARTEHTATLLSDGRVLFAGGRAAGRVLDSTEIFDPATSKFSFGPSLTRARAGHRSEKLLSP